jgi:hypothetical protein
MRQCIAIRYFVLWNFREGEKMERKTGFEPATCSLGSCRSTN